ncbi:hypothetical protein [Paenibacillus marinisediminis]
MRLKYPGRDISYPAVHTHHMRGVCCTVNSAYSPLLGVRIPDRMDDQLMVEHSTSTRALVKKQPLTGIHCGSHSTLRSGSAIRGYRCESAQLVCCSMKGVNVGCKLTEHSFSDSAAESWTAPWLKRDSASTAGGFLH